MLKHHITKYVEDGSWYAEAWIQLNLFRWTFCFCKKRLLLRDKPRPLTDETMSILLETARKSAREAFLEAIDDSN